MIRLRLAALALVAFSASTSAVSLAVEPAGGPAYPEESDGVAPGADAPDASVSERSWLGDNAPSERTEGALGDSSQSSSGFTLGALIIVLGLAGGAVTLHLRKRKLSPLPKRESRLDVLSSSRIGPKAFAVTAHVGGRVMLLGVTDHNVTLLSWLDAEGKPEDDNDLVIEEAVDATGEEDLPDDYPGSAFRQSSAPKPSYATTHDLKRFQEVLRGTVQIKDSPLGRAPLSRPPSAASTLAAQTTDIVLSQASPFRSSTAPVAPISMVPARPSLVPAEAPAASANRPAAVPNSLRRKRQKRNESAPVVSKSKAAPADNAAPDFEGQVAGLKSLKGG